MNTPYTSREDKVAFAIIQVVKVALLVGVASFVWFPIACLVSSIRDNNWEGICGFGFLTLALSIPFLVLILYCIKNWGNWDDVVD